MSSNSTLSLKQVCEHFHIEVEAVVDLSEFGLFPTILIGGVMSIEFEYLEKLRDIINLYQALGVNKEGIEVILNLRKRTLALQAEVENLHNEVAGLECHLDRDKPEALRGRGLLIEIEC